MAKVNKKFCKTKKNKEKFICRNRVLAIYVFLKKMKDVMISQG